MTEPQESKDYSKTRAYATIDLASKIISAIGLVALGLAGWMLQSNVEMSRRNAEAFELQERKYLPELRSLGELELALEEMARKPLTYGDLAGLGTDELHRLHMELWSASASLFEPDGENEISFPSIDSTNPSAQPKKLSLRSAAFMYTDLLLAVQLIADDQGEWIIRFEEPSIIVERKAERKAYHIAASAESLPALRVWLADQQLSSRVLRQSMLVWAGALRRSAGEVIQKVLREHPDLGDRYVQIRGELKQSSAVKTAPDSTNKR